MKTRSVVLSGALVLLGLGAFAATGFGQGGDAPNGPAGLDGDALKAPRGKPVVKGVVRTNKPASASVSATAKAAGKAKVRYFTASRATFIPPLGAGPVTRLKCPRKFSAIGGFYTTDGGEVADEFNSVSVRTWSYRFIDLSGFGGSVLEGVVCVK